MGGRKTVLDNSDYILELLLEFGMITEDQVNEGWEEVAKADGEFGIIEALIKLDYIEEDEMMAMLAQHYGLETLDLNGYKIPFDVIELVSEELVNQYHIIPVMKNGDTLTIAMADPTDLDTLDALRYLLKCDVDAVISPKDQITEAIERNYGGLEGLEVSSSSNPEEMEIESQLQKELMMDPSANSGDDAPIIRLVSMIIIEAFKMGGSDIHLEPLEKRYRVRYRVDGVLREVEGPPKYLQPNLTSRIKIMAKLDIAEKRIPQDGRIKLAMSGKDIDLRVSTVPTTHGESIVMRILDKSNVQLDIPKLGFYSDDQKIIEKVLSYPDGIFLVTGPTGSGKTTSLYAFLNTLNQPNRKIITVEDPIEYQLDGINQVQADYKIGLSFDAALRSMLRQAPNIIMVGEIRDMQTGEIAINAALTGHLVFSTLHTNDAPGAVTRLIEMGIQPFLVASAVRAIMAQRLVRRVCPECAEPYTPDAAERRVLNLTDEAIERASFVKGKGCALCGNTGYKGRMGIYEIFQITEDIQHLIYDKASSDEIRTSARRGGMRTLSDDGLRKAAAGTTTIEEIVRMTVMDSE